jgi:hypothetical protein
MYLLFLLLAATAAAAAAFEITPDVLLSIYKGNHWAVVKFPGDNGYALFCPKDSKKAAKFHPSFPQAIERMRVAMKDKSIPCEVSLSGENILGDCVLIHDIYTKYQYEFTELARFLKMDHPDEEEFNAIKERLGEVDVAIIKF